MKTCIVCGSSSDEDGNHLDRESDLATVAERMQPVAAECDAMLEKRDCSCGGRYSIAAPPRCPHCRHVVLESSFHVAYVPEPDE